MKMISIDKRKQSFALEGDGQSVLEEYMMIAERLKKMFMQDVLDAGKDVNEAHEIVDRLIMDSVAFALCTPEEQTEILRRENDGN